MESILTSIKKLLGITEEYEHFDADIVMYINTALNVLTQLGVGPKEGFQIKDKTAVWSDFITDTRLNMIKSYVHMKVKLLFESNTMSGTAIEAINKELANLEWRINSVVDYEK